MFLICDGVLLFIKIPTIMNQQHITKIKDTVNEIGLIGTLDIFGGDKSIIKQTFIDNPESYLDYLIGNILVVKQPVTDKICFVNSELNYQIIFECNRPEYEYQLDGKIIVNDFIWNYFYVHIMNLPDTEIQSIFKSWLSKHIPNVKHLTPVSKSNEFLINFYQYQV